MTKDRRIEIVARIAGQLVAGELACPPVVDAHGNDYSPNWRYFDNGKTVFRQAVNDAAELLSAAEDVVDELWD